MHMGLFVTSTAHILFIIMSSLVLTHGTGAEVLVRLVFSILNDYGIWLRWLVGVWLLLVDRERSCVLCVFSVSCCQPFS